MLAWLVSAKHKRRLRLLIYCVLVLASTTAADYSSSTALGRWAELRTYDLRFMLRGSLPASPAVPVTILAIDEKALSYIPDPLMFWHKEFVLVLGQLDRHRASVIGVDFIFADVSRFDPEGQRNLGEVLLQAAAEASMAHFYGWISAGTPLFQGWTSPPLLLVWPYGGVYACLNCCAGNGGEESSRRIRNNRRYRQLRQAVFERGLFPDCRGCRDLQQRS